MNKPPNFFERFPWEIMWDTGASPVRRTLSGIWLLIWGAVVIWLWPNREFVVSVLFCGAVVYWGVLQQSGNTEEEERDSTEEG